jgi:hypothetical protein
VEISIICIPFGFKHGFLSTSLQINSMGWNNRFRGVMVSVLAIGPKVHRFKHGRGDGFLMVINIRSTTSFGGELKPPGPMS